MWSMMKNAGEHEYIFTVSIYFERYIERERGRERGEGEKEREGGRE